ncbi:MAG: branched-chain amino acid ABC transporter permease [Candidatus Bathyarchaeia archaeon]|nr:branched-chain amino acid ABC transporter permease [Candidatus Bathyarchaeota archaeon]
MLELIIDGITFGLLLSLLGVGITLIFGLGEILNLAHGEFAVICAMLALIFMERGVNTLLSIILGLLITGLIGLALERSLISLVYRARGETRILLGIFITFGLSLAIHSYLVNTIPKAFFSVKLPFEAIRIGGLIIRPSTLLSAVISVLALVLLEVFLKKTYTGKAIRAIAQDEMDAQLCGVNPAPLRTLVFILGAVMAGLAGILYGLIATVAVIIGVDFTLLALIVAIVGGVRSIYGNILSGVILGIVHTIASFFLGAYLSLVILLSVTIIIILTRPEGILGEKG